MTTANTATGTIPPVRESRAIDGKLEIMSPADMAKEAGQTLTLYGDRPFELKMPEAMTEADYLAFGVNIGRAMEFAAWRVGDWVNFGMQKFAYKDYERLSAVTGLSQQYLASCSSVASRVGSELRLGVSLERARLIMSRKGQKESVEHLFGRLKGKTMDQLRKLGASGSAPKKKKADPLAGPSVKDAYDCAKTLLVSLQELKPEGLVLLGAYEKDGNVLSALLNELMTALTAIEDVAETPAKK